MRSTLFTALALIGAIAPCSDTAQGTPEAATEAAATIIPASEEVARIVKATTVSFAKAIKAKDLKSFYDELAPEFRTEVSYAEFESRYAPFKKAHADIRAVENVQAQLSAEPSLTKSGRMHVGGFFLLSNGRVEFTYEYFHRASGWQLAGMHIEIDTAVDDDKDMLADLRAKAERGDAEAQLNLGLRLHDGTSVPRNEVEAVQWYRKAAEGGNAMAQVMLGYALMNGRGVTKDEAAGVGWYKRAAQLGNAHAQRYLGIAYAEGTGVQKDETQAAVWVLKAAKQGEVDAQDLYAAMLEEGIGVRKDLTESIVWWHKAAAQGDVYALKHLEKLQRDGVGGTH